MKNLSALSLSPSLTAPPFKIVTHGSLQVWGWGVRVRQEVGSTQEPRRRGVLRALTAPAPGSASRHRCTAAAEESPSPWPPPAWGRNLVFQCPPSYWALSYTTRKVGINTTALWTLQRKNKKVHLRPELLRLMLRRLGKRRLSISWESATDFTLLLASTRVLRPGYIRPSFLTSAQSCSWLSVICSRRSEGQDVCVSET